jgi:hypothetical protein
MVATSRDGTIGVSYAQDDGTSAHDIVERYQESRDGGATWSAPVSLSSASFQPWSSFHQDGFVFMGDYAGLAAGSDGLFHATWTDTRDGSANVYAATVSP